MSLMKGLGKIAAAKKAMDQKVAANKANFFKLDAGETAIVRFNIREDEPEITSSHFNNRNRGASVRHSEENCVACFYKDRGHKYLGYPSDRAGFNLIDCRFMHVEESKTEKTKGGKPKRIYTPCTEDVSCKGCRRKLERERGGQKFWEMALSHATSVATVNKQLSKKCKSCDGVGKITVTDYQCPNCAVSVEYTPPDEEGEEEARVTCGSCQTEMVPSEIIACSQGCDWPERGSIDSTNIEVTRTGSDKQTNYNFVPQIPFVPMEPWMEQCQPLDLKAVFKPQSPEIQAKILGLENPFAEAAEGDESEGGSEGYEDEEPMADEEEAMKEEAPAGDESDDDIPF